MSAAKFTIVNIGTLSMNKFWGETERLRSATATCTLLQIGEQRLLVDPSPGPELLEPMLFAQTGLRPGQVDSVFITHWHGDHRYGLDLFPHATWLMAGQGLKEWQEECARSATGCGAARSVSDCRGASAAGGRALALTRSHVWPLFATGRYSVGSCHRVWRCGDGPGVV